MAKNARGERTKQAIVAAAVQLFDAEGLNAVTMTSVAEAAGVTRATLYLHFPRKDDLVLAAVHEERQIRLTTLLDALDAIPTPTGRVLGVFGWLESGTGRLNAGRFLSAALEAGSEDVVSVALDHKVDLKAILLDLARKSAAVDPLALADGLYLLAEGTVAAMASEGSEGTARRASSAARALLTGYGVAVDADLPASF